MLEVRKEGRKETVKYHYLAFCNNCDMGNVEEHRIVGAGKEEITEDAL